MSIEQAEAEALAKGLSPERIAAVKADAAKFAARFQQAAAPLLRALKEAHESNALLEAAVASLELRITKMESRVGPL